MRLEIEDFLQVLLGQSAIKSLLLVACRCFAFWIVRAVRELDSFLGHPSNFRN